MATARLTRAERNIAWCEKHLRIPEGQFVGQPLRMTDFMKDDFRAIYDNPAGTRLAIISRGRKNAKTTESAMLVLLHTCGPEARRNSQLYSAAQSREQAGILFQLASKMVRMSPTLSQFVTVRDSGKQLHCPELGTLYRALSADASTAYGLSPVLTVHDELGQVKGPKSELYEALETATAAQQAPMSIVISTQAPTDADLLSILIDDALTGRDPRTVLRFQTAGLELPTFSEAAIRAANPAFDLFMNKREVLGMASNAEAMPSKQPEFENLVLNRRVEMFAPFVSRGIWAINNAPPVEFDGLAVYGGLDLSEVQDLTALVLVAPEGGRWHVRPTFWLPREGLREKSAKDKVPYDVWEKDGKLEAAPGRTVDYGFVASYLRAVCNRLDVRGIAFDRYNFKHLRPYLIRAGFSEADVEARFKEFGQGFVSMSPALRELETDLLNGRMCHGDHPVLKMCAANAVVLQDPAGNRKLDKHRSRGRIDGMVSLAMARAIATTHEETVVPVSPWDDPEFRLN